MSGGKKLGGALTQTATRTGRKGCAHYELTGGKISFPVPGARFHETFSHDTLHELLSESHFIVLWYLVWGLRATDAIPTCCLSTKQRGLDTTVQCTQERTDRRQCQNLLGGLCVKHREMPRRCRPWVSPHNLATSASVVTAAAMLAASYRSTAAFAFVPLQSPLQSSCSRTTAWLARGNSAAGSSRRVVVQMVAQDVVPTEYVVGAPSGRPPPFQTRKLGSFEKMLTQTRDGVGPAEEGVRTLLTPHVWVREACLRWSRNRKHDD